MIVVRLITDPKARCWLLRVAAAVYEHRCDGDRAGGLADDDDDLERDGSHPARGGGCGWALRYYL